MGDEKRRRIRAGDSIVFINTESGEKLHCTVLALHSFDSFKELYKALPLLRCGYTKSDIDTAKPEDMALYYSPEQQEKYGVLGIEIRLE